MIGSMGALGARTGRSVLAALLCVAAASGCSLLVSVDDDLSGGGGGPADGGTTSPEASTTLTTDGGGTATGDGSPPTTTPFCSGQATALFCEDFDTKDPASAFGYVEQQSGKVSRTGAQYVSPGFAMEAHVDAVPNGIASALGAQELSAGAVLSAEAKVRLEARTTPAPDRSADLMSIELIRNGPAEWGVGLRALSLGDVPTLELFQYDNVKKTETVLGPRVAIDEKAWMSLRVRVDLAGKTAEVRRMDAAGSPVLAAGTIAPPVDVVFPTKWQFVVGLYTQGAQTGWTAQFDDLLVRAP